MDAEFYYFKNSSPEEKEIKIPKSRSTLDQYTIIKACLDFDLENDSSCASIPDEIFKDNIPDFKEVRQRKKGSYSDDGCIDSGFLLKLTKK